MNYKIPNSRRLHAGHDGNPKICNKRCCPCQVGSLFANTMRILLVNLLKASLTARGRLCSGSHTTGQEVGNMFVRTGQGRFFQGFPNKADAQPRHRAGNSGCEKQLRLLSVSATAETVMSPFASLFALTHPSNRLRFPSNLQPRRTKCFPCGLTGATVHTDPR